MIFRPSLTIQKFFKNRSSSFDISDSRFSDQLDELFYMVEKIFFERKSKFQILFQRPICTTSIIKVDFFCRNREVAVGFIWAAPSSGKTGTLWKKWSSKTQLSDFLIWQSISELPWKKLVTIGLKGNYEKWAEQLEYREKLS